MQKPTKENNKDSLSIYESEEKYRVLFENAPSAIVIFDLKGNIIDFNETTTKVLGYEKKEYLGKNFLEIGLFKPETIPILRKRLGIYVSGKKPEPIELEAYRKDGSIIWLNPTVSLVKLKHQTVIEIIFHDVSEKVEAKAKLAESERNYSHAFNRANFYKDLFTHDINNILNVILSSVDLISMFSKEPSKEKEIAEMFDIIKKQITKGSKLISDIRKLSQFDKPEGILTNVNCYKVLKESIDFVTKSFKTTNLSIAIEAAEKNAIILANSLLSEVFENILINSIKHNNNPNILITIRVSRIQKECKNHLKIELIDNGVGITDDKKLAVFQPGHLETKSEKGMGFGLSLVKQIIENFNGTIHVEDAVKGDSSKGSNFILIFPEPSNN